MVRSCCTTFRPRNDKHCRLSVNPRTGSRIVYGVRVGLAQEHLGDHQHLARRYARADQAFATDRASAPCAAR
jgi:hypothetical protein